MAKPRAAHSAVPKCIPAAGPPPMQQAWMFYSRGEWQQAEALCRTHLRRQPQNFAALTLLGIVAAQTNRTVEAEELLARAVRVNAREPEAHNNYGNVLRDLQRHAEAIASYERALALKPDYAEAHYNRGVVLQAQERYAQALTSYERALALRPRYAAAYNNRGVVLRELGRFEEALDSYERALAIDARHAPACNNRGVTLHQMDRLEEALASYAEALALNPRDVGALKNRGWALCCLGEPEEAQQSYRRALELQPHDADAHCGLGQALRRCREPEAALASFERALALDPNHAEAHYQCGNLLRSRGELTLALASYERALQLNPLIAGLQGALLVLRMQRCEWDGYEESLGALQAGLETGQTVAFPFSAMVLIDSPRLQQRAAEAWVADKCPQRRELPPLARRPRAERIRIGYFSADFYRHATMLLAGELFGKHDRRRFEVVGLRFGRHQGDEVTQQAATAFDRFIDVREHSDVEVARLSRELAIDIAVDLKGLTEQHRLGVFAHRAAPLQVNYLAYPGTLGAPYMDYIVADRTLIPEEHSAHYTEKIVYLPGSYQINDRSRTIAEPAPTREQLGLPAQGFVFCCFNNVYKITPPVFDVWMRLLGRVPGSVLWLMEGGSEGDARLRSAAQKRGIGAERLVFAPRVALPEHLARHRAADLFIDAYPCSAHTTASDALWAGLPLVTCAGESFAARVAASLLQAIGLPELIARGLPQYESLIMQLANEPARLAALRARLQRNRLEQPLFDLDRYVQGLEAAFEQMYERYQSGQPPEHIRL